MDKNENMEMVQGIVDELEKYASGGYFLHHGELFPIDYDDFNTIEGCSYNEEVYTLPDGEEILEGDIEPASLYDYFTDCLDVDYIVDSQKQFKAVRVLITCGGPNIYIDSYSGEVQLYWWSERATAVIPAIICNEINEVFRDYYYC